MFWRFWLALALAWSGAASATPLQTIGTFCGLYPDQCRKGTEALLAARGSGTNLYYVLEVDPLTGALPVTGSLVVTPSAPVLTGSNQAVGSLDCSSLTAAYATVVAPGFDTKILYVFNTCNQTIRISIDGGTTDLFILETSESVSIDLATNGKRIGSGVALQAKHNGVVPTEGTVRISAIGG